MSRQGSKKARRPQRLRIRNTHHSDDHSRSEEERDEDLWEALVPDERVG